MGRVFTIANGLENIGALRTGGQGSVYKARRGAQITAVKILPTPIHSEDENDKNFIDFKNEVAKLERVNEEPNPNIVKILSSGITESGSLPYIEMEFIEGPDLQDLLKPPLDTVFTIQECVKVAEQLSGALAHCHKLSVKHGDLKSNNVRFNIQTGHYVLLDFGLAVMADEQRRTSMRNAGAVEFMAPEQHEGELSVCSDVYSLGIILYELLAGVVPFPLLVKGESARNAVMISHVESPLPDILALRVQNIPPEWDERKRDFEMTVPAWLLSVIAKCLEKRPENRYEDGVRLHKEILELKDLYFGTYEYDSTDNTVLKRDNERLTTLLRQYQRSADTIAAPAARILTTPVGFCEVAGSEDSSIKRLLKNVLTKLRTANRNPVLLGAGLILACLILFAGYSASNSQNAEVTDSLALEIGLAPARDSIQAVVEQSEKAAHSELPRDKGNERQSEKHREKRNKQAEKQRERNKKDGEKIREELKKRYEKLREGKDN